MNENEPVNENTTDSPEKRVADYVEDLCRHIADNGYDLLADVAVESLVANGAVPSGAYLHSVKTAWCLHRAAFHYARQYGVERSAADRARADAQFEHSHRTQAERKAERLEAELAQSVLLVENQRLRMEEMEQQQREVRQQMLETAQAALLEQQQRNEQLVTHNSQQLMKISELQTQVEFLKGRLMEEVRRISELQEQKKQEQVIPATTEYAPPPGWRMLQFGETLQEGDVFITASGELWSARRVGEVVNNNRYIRQVEQTEPEPEPEQSADDAQCPFERIKMLSQCIDEQAETIARLQSEISDLNKEVCKLERTQKDDRIADSGTLDAGTAEPEPQAEYSAPEGWRLLQVGEVIAAEDQIVRLDDGKRHPTYLVGCRVGAGQRYIRRIEQQPEPQPVQVCAGQWRTRCGDVRNVTPTPADHHLQDRFPWWDSSTLQTWRNDGRYTGEKESPFDLREFIVPTEPEPQEDQITTPDNATGLVGQQQIRDLVLQVAAMIEDREQTAEPEPGSEQIAS